MKFVIKGPFKDNVYNLMREVGYYILEKNEKTGEMNLIRPMRGGGYPRFHLFSKMEGGNFIFDLHLDQKKPSYKGSAAHSGEYDGELVEKEAERIKEIIYQ